MVNGKQIIYFIGLKLAEIGGIIAGIYLWYLAGNVLDTLICKLTQQCELESPVTLFVAGVCIISLTILALAILIWIVCKFVKANWKWAGKLAKKKSRRKNGDL